MIQNLSFSGKEDENPLLEILSKHVIVFALKAFLIKPYVGSFLLGILNIITKSRLSFLNLITVPKMPNLSLIPLKPSCHPQHDMRDAVLKYAIAHLNK